MNKIVIRVLEFIKRHRLLEPGEGALVGLSGGPDSVALVLILKGLASSGELPLEIHLGHLNHGLRGAESDADEAFCKAFARKHLLPIETGRTDVRRMAARGESLEAAGRRARYGFLAQVAWQKGLKTIAVGHHADDVAETVLMRLLRGCGLHGLGAIPPERPVSFGSDIRIVRPLLDLRKRELLDFLAARGEPYRIDASNVSTEFLRNRIRLALATASQSSTSDLTGPLCEVNRLALEINAALERILDAQWPSLCLETRPGEVTLDAENLARLPLAERTLAARRALSSISDAAFSLPLSLTHYKALALLPEQAVGAELTLPGGFFARREHGIIYLSYRSTKLSIPPSELPIPGKLTLGHPCEGFKPSQGLEALSAEVIDMPPGGPGELIARASDYEVFLSLDALALPMTVRSRRAGDRFHPLGAPGERKLKEFFIDRKVPQHERDQTPLVVSGDGRIAWVVGHAIAEPFKLTGSERQVVRLKARAARSTGTAVEGEDSKLSSPGR